jgi:hypothetical protein
VLAAMIVANAVINGPTTELLLVVPISIHV